MKKNNLTLNFSKQSCLPSSCRSYRCWASCRSCCCWASCRSCRCWASCRNYRFWDSFRSCRGWYIEDSYFIDWKFDWRDNLTQDPSVGICIVNNSNIPFHAAGDILDSRQDLTSVTFKHRTDMLQLVKT